MRLRKSDGEERGTEENEEKGTAREKGTVRKRDGGKFSLLRKGDGPCNIMRKRDGGKFSPLRKGDGHNNHIS